jgi:putative membrane protein
MSKLPQIDRQREHQANERTFLAWLRTSIALIGFGFAIARFGIFIQQLEISLMHRESPNQFWINSENLGGILVIFGIIVIVLALLNYNRAFWQIERGNYQPNRMMVWMTGIMVVIFGLFSLTLMLRVKSSPRLNPSMQEQKIDIFDE